MIQKQSKHIVTYHGCLSFCYRNDTETKQTQKLHHGRLRFCYRNDTETKQTQKLLTMVVLRFCYRNDTETKQTQKLLTMVCYGNDTNLP